MERPGRRRTETGRRPRGRPFAGIAPAAIALVLCPVVGRAETGTRAMASLEGSKADASTPIIWPARSPAVHDPAPEPGLGPAAVVDIVLHALQRNDEPVADHGIAVTFAFTSPENHDITGPLDRFRALVKSSAFRTMIGHTRADRGPLVVVAAHARERVEITGAHGERVVYVFLLSRQETGMYKGCWMADGVLRETDAALESRSAPLMRAVDLRRD